MGKKNGPRTGKMSARDSNRFSLVSNYFRKINLIVKSIRDRLLDILLTLFWGHSIEKFSLN